MTNSKIDRVQFESTALSAWEALHPRDLNWPVVYTIYGPGQIYIGETTHLVIRMRQHLTNAGRRHLTSVRVVIDRTFNKSACLDLESFLIRWFSGDGKYIVQNSHAGLTDSNYYERDRYREQFREIFDQLRSEGLFEKSIAQIENSDLFKLSPYKVLTDDQHIAILEILKRLFDDLRSGEPSTAVIQGQPGTGKTIVGIYLMKLLGDIRLATALEDTDSDVVFSEFFTEQNAALLQDFRMGLVIPQQSLRKTVKKVFKKTSGLSNRLVLSPFEVGGSAESFDLLIVDESHRLQQLSATLPNLITKFKQINARLFNGNERGGHQLDWIRRKSRHQIFLLDAQQSVRPASDLPAQVIRELEQEAASTGRRFALKSQMRVRAGEDYVGYIRAMLSQQPPTRVAFADYDLKLFDDLGEMQKAILAREAEFGLSRLVAGFAWKWISKNDKSLFDIQIDGQQMQWNNTDTDWINSPTSIDEVGSIHTTQGYDLNFAGVIIGPDLRYDPVGRRLFIVRDSYFDSKGKSNNRMLGFEYTDEDLLTYIANIYAVLLTRGIRGTYVYVCNPELRKYLANFIPRAKPSVTDIASDSSHPSTPDVIHSVDGDASPEVQTSPIKHREPVSELDATDL